MADNKTYDAKPEKSTKQLDGPANQMSQTKVYSRTGNVKTPAEAGAGKPSTPFPW